MKLSKHIHWVIYSIFVLACARQTTPTGGPKDSIPPTLLSSIPKHGQVNFKGKTIQLTFSESIILNNPKEQLIITPDLGKDVDVKSKKNQVILAVPEDLKENTTYSINFRETVQDITEKNSAVNLKLAFSTGTYIDSLSIQGNAKNLLIDKELANATVALFETDTFDIFNHRPTYITKTDSKGNFILENLKPGNYFMYGMDDKNKNLIVDSKTESYAFLRNSIPLTENVKNINLSFIHLDSRPLKLTSARPYGTYFNIKTTKSLTSFKTTTTDDEIIISSFGEDLTNIRVYNTFKDRDSVAIRFTARDSISNSIDTTLYVKFTKRDVSPEKFDVTLNDFAVIGTKGIIQGKITFTKPILSINFDSIYYHIDSTKRISFSKENLQWDSLNNQLFIQKTFDKSLLPKEGTSNAGTDPRKKPLSPSSPKTNAKSAPENELYLGTGTFVSIELDSSKKVTERLTPTKLEETGILFVEIETTAPYFFVELLAKDFKILSTKRNLKKMSFEDLKPGDYQIRLVVDENNNGKWDPGNYYLNQEPEKIVFYKNEKDVSLVNLKANWELGPLLIKN